MTIQGSERQLSGRRIISALKEASVEYILSVPDLHTSKGLLAPIAKDPDLKLVRVCKEDECFGISAGLTYGRKRATILIQYTGMLYALNAIRAISCEHRMPTVMMVGLLAKEPDRLPRDSGRFGVRIVEPILDVLGIKHIYIDHDDDIENISPAIDLAYRTSSPVAFLIGRSPV